MRQLLDIINDVLAVLIGLVVLVICALAVRFGALRGKCWEAEE